MDASTADSGHIQTAGLMQRCFPALLLQSSRVDASVTGLQHIARFTSDAAGGPTSVAEQMVQYAVQQLKAGQHDQASDVLKSGLSMQPSGAGTDYARLMLTLARVEADRNHWGEVSSCAQAAIKAAAPGDTGGTPEAHNLRAVAAHATVNSLLLQGKDEDALGAARDPATPHSSLARLLVLGTSLSAQHATGNFTGAQGAAAELAACAGLPHATNTGSSLQHQSQHGQPSQSLIVSSALNALGDWYAAKAIGSMQKTGNAPSHSSSSSDSSSSSSSGGSTDEVHTTAVQRYSQAAEVAEIALSADQQKQQTRPEDAPALGEALAAAHLGRAQLAMAQTKWDEAEDILGKALKAAEGVSSETNPRIVPALMLLGYVYARSARVTFAEGLLRESCKILKVDATRSTSPSYSLLHPSLAAMLAWRYFQLLSVLPRRGSEAAAWRQLALSAWQAAGPVANHPQGTSIEDVLGGEEHLKGVGAPGSGALVVLQSRRLYPVVKP